MMDQKSSFLYLVPLGLACAAAGFALNACGESGSGKGNAGRSANGGGDAGTTTTTSGGGGTPATGGGTAAGGAGGTGGAGVGGSTGAGGHGTVQCDAPGGQVPALKLTRVATGFTRPLYVTSEPEDPTRLYVVEQTGRIWLLKNGQMQQRPFLDVSALIYPPASAQDEQGLLGLAFHPNYAKNGRFYIYYSTTATNPGSVPPDSRHVAEFVRSPSDPDVANATPAKHFFYASAETAPNHQGGMLAFGPDGFLYAGVGDGGGDGDPYNHGQNKNIKLGKILRINVDTYPTPPPGNLPGADPDVWDYGLRNPWRFSFDRCSGDLYIGDVGQDALEEIDVEPRGQGHKNYGWSIKEGTNCFKPDQAPGCNSPTLTSPVKAYGHGNSDGSVIGGYVYRGSKIPALRGRYIYGDYASNRIWTFIWKNGSISSEVDLTDNLQSMSVLRALASFGEDASGELYVVDTGTSGGSIYRIDPK